MTKYFPPDFTILFSCYSQERPFDRHDWYVKRGNREVRYVIDFYNVRQNREDEPVAVYIDARPGIDNLPYNNFNSICVVS